jgi:hypothetical protein
MNPDNEAEVLAAVQSLDKSTDEVIMKKQLREAERNNQSTSTCFL